MHFLRTLAVVLFSSVLFAQSALEEPVSAAAVTPPFTPTESREITYLTASGQDQKLDVYQHPSKDPAPVIVYFHGGAWWKGERPKNWHSFHQFLELGFSVVSVDYRLAGVAPAPAAAQDARCALSWVRKNAAKYNFDPERIVAYGTSAGGHLAMIAGFAPATSDFDLAECAPIPKVAAVLDYYGIVDVSRWLDVEHTRSQAMSWLPVGPDRMALGRKMSPINYVKAGLPPVFIVHGDADPVVPYSQSTQLQDALSAHGVPHELITVPGGAHGKFTPEQQEIVKQAVSKFLRTYVLKSTAAK